MTTIKEEFNKTNQIKSPAPFSLRFTKEEREQLDRMAQGMPLGKFIRSKLFDGNTAPRRTKGRFPVKDEKALSKLLGVLGKSRIANNINQLARAANLGSLPVNIETQKKLDDACRAIFWIRQQLILSLGLKQE
jgi:hypothetical protein